MDDGMDDGMGDGGGKRGRFFQYDPTVHLGHLLTVGTVLLGGFTWALGIERSDARQDARIEALYAQYTDIRELLIRIDDKLDKKADK